MFVSQSPPSPPPTIDCGEITPPPPSESRRTQSPVKSDSWDTGPQNPSFFSDPKTPPPPPLVERKGETAREMALTEFVPAEG